MKNYRITTESGAVYLIKDGLCVKTDRHGVDHAPFKVWTLKSVGDEVKTWLDVFTAPHVLPQVGKRLYVSGKDEWWLSSTITQAEELGGADD